MERFCPVNSGLTEQAQWLLSIPSHVHSALGHTKSLSASTNLFQCLTVSRTQQANHCSGKHLCYVSLCQSLLFFWGMYFRSHVYLSAWEHPEWTMWGLTAVSFPSGWDWDGGCLVLGEYWTQLVEIRLRLFAQRLVCFLYSRVLMHWQNIQFWNLFFEGFRWGQFQRDSPGT